MIRFSTYYGHDIWIDPDRVLSVTDGGCGSRGLSAVVLFDTGKLETLLGRAYDVQRQISEAKAASGA